MQSSNTYSHNQVPDNREHIGGRNSANLGNDCNRLSLKQSTYAAIL